MTKQQFERLCMQAVQKVRECAPRDTGNLANNGVNYVWEDEKTFVIYVDEDVAPYMPFTNEPWISPKWNGKQNPNEAWWQDAVKIVVETIQRDYKGEVK